MENKYCTKNHLHEIFTEEVSEADKRVILELKSYKVKSKNDIRNVIREMSLKKDTITLKDCKDCLLNNGDQMRKMNVIRSHFHEIYKEEVNKIVLSAEGDKRVILEDGNLTLAYGHYRLKERKDECTHKKKKMLKE